MLQKPTVQFMQYSLWLITTQFNGGTRPQIVVYIHWQQIEDVKYLFYHDLPE